MSSAGDKAWRSIFKFINDMDESEDLDDATKVNTMLIELKISMDLRSDLQDMTSAPKETCCLTFR